MRKKTPNTRPMFAAMSTGIGIRSTRSRNRGTRKYAISPAASGEQRDAHGGNGTGGTRSKPSNGADGHERGQPEPDADERRDTRPQRERRRADEEAGQDGDECNFGDGANEIEHGSLQFSVYAPI